MSPSQLPPDWIEPLLKTVPPPRFRRSARQAVESAAGIAPSLRQALDRLAPPPAHVQTFLARLALEAGLSPDLVGTWAGLPRDPLDPRFGRVWGRLASVLGLDRSETLRHLRLSLLTASGAGLSLGLAARDPSEHPPSSPIDPLAETDRLIRDEIAALDADRRSRIQVVEDSTLAAFQDHDQ